MMPIFCGLSINYKATDRSGLHSNHACHKRWLNGGFKKGHPGKIHSETHMELYRPCQEVTVVQESRSRGQESHKKGPTYFGTCSVLPRAHFTSTRA